MEVNLQLTLMEDSFAVEKPALSNCHLVITACHLANLPYSLKCSDGLLLSITSWFMC